MANLLDDLQALDLSAYRYQDQVIWKLAVALAAMLDGQPAPQWSADEFWDLPHKFELSDGRLFAKLWQMYRFKTERPEGEKRAVRQAKAGQSKSPGVASWSAD